MYKEEIVKKCLVDNYTSLLEEKGYNINDLIMNTQIVFHEEILSISFYRITTKTIVTLYISKQSLDETISEIRDEKIKKLLYE
jgi:hypothetical protein